MTDAYNSQLRYNIAECEGGSEEEKSDGERSTKATKTTAKENRPSKEEGMGGAFHNDMFVMFFMIRDVKIISLNVVFHNQNFRIFPLNISHR